MLIPAMRRKVPMDDEGAGVADTIRIPSRVLYEYLKRSANSPAYRLVVQLTSCIIELRETVATIVPIRCSCSINSYLTKISSLYPGLILAIYLGLILAIYLARYHPQQWYEFI